MALVALDTSQQILVKRLLFEDNWGIDFAYVAYRSTIAALNASGAALRQRARSRMLPDWDGGHSGRCLVRIVLLVLIDGHDR